MSTSQAIRTTLAQTLTSEEIAAYVSGDAARFSVVGKDESTGSAVLLVAVTRYGITTEREATTGVTRYTSKARRDRSAYMAARRAAAKAAASK